MIDSMVIMVRWQHIGGVREDELSCVIARLPACKPDRYAVLQRHTQIVTAVVQMVSGIIQCSDIFNVLAVGHLMRIIRIIQAHITRIFFRKRFFCTWY